MRVHPSDSALPSSSRLIEPFRYDTKLGWATSDFQRAQFETYDNGVVYVSYRPQ